ncbi:cyclomaltodextrinase N-terminal domain-containing protein [Sphingobacterium daejeonense]|nr:cyclomaltodextrinase N-terminal domain-containing protein [Sphingobacterium daejeonense]VTQ06463.1 Cyclomaltodextrinase, N-terminal [Sphingobacterium daejeonense]
MRIIIAIIFICLQFSSYAQVDRIEPLNWWVGMNNPNVQLLVYGNKYLQ